ncbi:hypothetical protein [Sphingobacterium sp. HMA12]|nr:hypothetical protein [Sphingobacterium sp. HMA12]
MVIRNETVTEKDCATDGAGEQRKNRCSPLTDRALRGIPTGNNPKISIR